MRFSALDSWRGLCAIAVAFFHFPIAGAIREFPLAAHGYLFVDFFFVLSGFVIATAWEGRLVSRDDDVWSFLLRRFGRLWPLHAAILALLVAVAIVQADLGSDEAHSIPSIFTHLGLVHGLGIHQSLTWNGPSWSISVEAALYCLFAALSLIRFRLALYIAFILLGLIVLQFFAPDGMASTFDFGFYRGLAGFFTGVLITRLPPVSLGWLAEMGTVAFVLLFVLLGQFTILAPFVFALTVFVFAHSNGFVSAFLKSPPLIRLGDWSYSIYMLHALFVAAIWQLSDVLGLSSDGPLLLSPSPAWTALIAAGYFIGILALSSVTYSFIEHPSRDAFNRIASKRRLSLAAKKLTGSDGLA